MTVLSLSQAPIPSAFVGCGSTSCAPCYTASNSLLDLVVNGCSLLIGAQIAATQPDAEDASAPAAGVGSPYTLATDGQHVVTACRDHTNAVVDFPACLTDTAYSIHFRFATDRVIIKN